MNKSHLLWKRAFLVLLTILLILLQSACDSNHSNIDLSQYLGKTLSEIESALGIEFTDMSEYRGFENTYRAEKRDGEFDCVIDSTGKVIRIHVLSSGKNGYSIFGVTSDMDAEAANEILTQSGIFHAFDTVWCCSNKTDAVIQESLGWSLEKDSVILEEVLFRVLIEENFTYKYDDSAGAYYIGNGQVVEYYYSSFPRFVYEYEKLTEYQQSIWNETNTGRYLMVAGTVQEVTDRGTVMVRCEDQSFDKEVGNIFPTVGFAELTLVPEQEALLISLAENSTIVAFGRIVPDSYDSFYDIYFDLSDTIVLATDSSTVSVPMIERPIPGITRFDESGNILLDYNAFWDSASWYDDEITGEYFNSENFIFFGISAGKSEKGAVTYWLTYQAGSERKEIDGDIIEIPQYLNLPSKQIWTDDSRIIVEFAVDGYCEYTGSFYLIKEYRDDGNIVDYICVNIPGFLSTSNAELYVAKI